MTMLAARPRSLDCSNFGTEFTLRTAVCMDRWNLQDTEISKGLEKHGGDQRKFREQFLQQDQEKVAIIICY